MKRIDQSQPPGGAQAPPGLPLQRTILFVFLLLLSGILTGMGSKPPQVSGTAPDFQTTLSSGEPVSSKDYRGKSVLLTFWATWCEPCKKEMPEIQAAYEAHKEEGLTVLAVNFGEKGGEAQAFADKMGLTFPVLLDRKINIAEQYGVVSLPVTFFIDRNGMIRERVFGGTLTKERIGEIVGQMKTK
ncbi:MAG TPA: TlpA disulfide reductase family protein [Candidatus Manganitrophaceae bacterium]|nr:TlpA disulfide reductase family protein [Candidatus Manganitrophaceae bacterium]